MLYFMLKKNINYVKDVGPLKIEWLILKWQGRVQW